MPIYEVRSKYVCPHRLEHVVLHVAADTYDAVRQHFPPYVGTGGWLIIRVDVLDLMSAMQYTLDYRGGGDDQQKGTGNEPGGQSEGAGGKGPAATGATVARPHG